MKKYRLDLVDIEFFTNGIIIHWEDMDNFFGNVTITKNAEDGSITIDDEYMSKNFVKAVFNAFIEKNYKEK